MTIEQRAGLSTARLRHFDGVIKDKYLDRGYLPGTITQVWRRGEMAHGSVMGSMDIERRIPMRPDAIFRIYSMTKAVTGVALMMLVEDGSIGLLEDVSAYIPAWKNLGVYQGGTRGAFRTKAPNRPMRVIDLAAHTAGLTYPWMSRTNVDAAYRDLGLDSFGFKGGLEAMIETLSTLPLEYSPGEAWLYSMSIDVLGYLVQKLSGLTFGEFLRQRLFNPLGMVDTGFFCPPEKLDRLTTCYVSNPDGSLKLQDDARHSTYAKPPALESGGGGLLSTAGDYMRFARMLLNGGSLDGVQILSPKSVALFSQNLLPAGRDMHQMGQHSSVYGAGGPLNALYAGIGASFAGGVTTDLVAAGLLGTVGEFGWYGAAETAFFVDPKEDLAFVFMTQTMGMKFSGALRRDLRTLVYSSFVEANA
jgi:CubicO group peptidase (beta-lactamase class C family)